MTDAGALVDDLFRRASGRLVARLVRRLGSARFDLAEDAVQHALMQALRQWPFTGVPENPEAWLTRTAWHRTVDVLRAEARALRLGGGPRAEADEDRVAAIDGRLPERDPDDDGDDELRLLLACCHPRIPLQARVALALKTVGGFGIHELARAFLADVPTVQQRLVRAKQLIARLHLSLELPSGEALAQRRDGVLAVLYLVFNEGYSASGGDELVRPRLCAEAIRLCNACAAHPQLGTPEVHALLALMLLQAARIDARVDAEGSLVPLPQQDRARWSAPLIARGHRALLRARTGTRLTSYHLQAGIAALHVSAPSWSDTDWRAVCELYDLLVAHAPTPIVRLNRAIALGERDGPLAAQRELEALAGEKALRRNAAYAGAQGECALRLGLLADALQHFARATALARTAPERRHFAARRSACDEAHRAACAAPAGDDTRATASARKVHTGGVNVVFSDGAVR